MVERLGALFIFPGRRGWRERRNHAPFGIKRL
jgi:hypothetical protein